MDRGADLAVGLPGARRDRPARARLRRHRARGAAAGQRRGAARPTRPPGRRVAGQPGTNRADVASTTMELTSPDAVAAALGSTGYLADDDLATVVFLSASMQRPLLLEGEPGTGKTALAEALAELTGTPADPAPVLRGDRRLAGALRLGTSRARSCTCAPWRPPPRRGAPGEGAFDAGEAEKSLFDGALPVGPAGAPRRCARPRPCCWSTRSTGPTTSSRRSCWRCCRPGQVTIPELGTVAAAHAAVRRTHVQPDARAARRAQAALPLSLDRPPGPRAREVAIVRRPGCPEVSRRRWPRQVVNRRPAGCGRASDLLKPPGVAETLDWVRALQRLGVDRARPGDGRLAHPGRHREVSRGHRPGEARPSTAMLSGI